MVVISTLGTTKSTGRRAPKVKSGCRTCKVRKVKCDESRPHCNRCISTGRKCDGYGIWSSPPKLPDHQHGLVATLPSKFSPALGNLTSDEVGYLEWFTHRAVSKMQGTTRTQFWEELIFQASYTEPAVLDAMLALGSAHRGYANSASSRRDYGVDRHEQFMLKHYNRSIERLGALCVANKTRSDSSGVKIALIVCVVFICLETIRGHSRCAHTHLKHGVGLLRHMECSDQEGMEGVKEALGRIGMQAVLLGQMDCMPFWKLDDYGIGGSAMPEFFKSAKEAMDHLDRILVQAIQLSGRWKKTQSSSSTTAAQPPASLSSLQKTLQTELQSWFEIYHSSRPNVNGDNGRIPPFLTNLTTHLLQTYSSLTTIILSTSLLSSEMAYDAFVNYFQQILSHSLQILHLVNTTRTEVHPLALRNDVPHFTADKAFLAPLYFTAIKCRDSSMRRKAIGLMGSHDGRAQEGIWDSRTAKLVAYELLRIEEEGSRRACGWTNDMREVDLMEERLITVPEGDRIHDVQVLLPNGLDDEVGLVCRRKLRDGTEEVIVRVYDPVTESWSSRSVGYTAARTPIPAADAWATM